MLCARRSIRCLPINSRNIFFPSIEIDLQTVIGYLWENPNVNLDSANLGIPFFCRLTCDSASASANRYPSIEICKFPSKLSCEKRSSSIAFFCGWFRRNAYARRLQRSKKKRVLRRVCWVWVEEYTTIKHIMRAINKEFILIFFDLIKYV